MIALRPGDTSTRRLVSASRGHTASNMARKHIYDYVELKGSKRRIARHAACGAPVAPSAVLPLTEAVETDTMKGQLDMLNISVSTSPVSQHAAKAVAASKRPQGAQGTAQMHVNSARHVTVPIQNYSK